MYALYDLTAPDCTMKIELNVAVVARNIAILCFIVFLPIEYRFPVDDNVVIHTLSIKKFNVEHQHIGGDRVQRIHVRERDIRELLRCSGARGRLRNGNNDSDTASTLQRR